MSYEDTYNAATYVLEASSIAGDSCFSVNRSGVDLMLADAVDSAALLALVGDRLAGCGEEPLLRMPGLPYVLGALLRHGFENNSSATEAFIEEMPTRLMSEAIRSAKLFFSNDRHELLRSLPTPEALAKYLRSVSENELHAMRYAARSAMDTIAN